MTVGGQADDRQRSTGCVLFGRACVAVRVCWEVRDLFFVAADCIP